jgi:hypothetical protein
MYYLYFPNELPRGKTSLILSHYDNFHRILHHTVWFNGGAIDFFQEEPGLSTCPPIWYQLSRLSRFS